MSLRQLALDLPHRAASGREDFLVSESNAAAVALIDSWPDWPAHAVLLIGPPGSGKTHLVGVWREQSRALVVNNIESGNVNNLLGSGALAIEDLPGSCLDETALFHLLNLAREEQARILITAREQPSQWAIRIPDLSSRLKALPVVAIGEPDDALLRGVLLKLFADRQIAVDDQLLSYLIARIPRSLETARVAVSEIDRLALEQGAAITRAFVARNLSQIIDEAQLNLFIE